MIPKVAHRVLVWVVVALVVAALWIDAAWRWLWGLDFDLKGRM